MESHTGGEVIDDNDHALSTVNTGQGWKSGHLEKTKGCLKRLQADKTPSNATSAETKRILEKEE